MDSYLEGAASNSLERRKLNINRKRQLVIEISKNRDEAPKVLKSWTYPELRQVLSSDPEKQKEYAGMSKEEIINLILKTIYEREGRFTGLSKEQIINVLLKTASEKNNGDGEVEEKNPSPSTSNSKRQEASTAQTKAILEEAAPEDLPIPPLRLDQITDHQDRPENVTNIEKSASCGFGLEDCVKITRQLESSGLIVREFRQKLLSWYGLRATAREMSVFKTFIHAFKDDPKALADQLIDTFSGCVLRQGSTNDGGSSRGGVSCKKSQR